MKSFFHFFYTNKLKNYFKNNSKQIYEILSDFSKNWEIAAKCGKSKKCGKNAARGSKMRQMPHFRGNWDTLVQFPNFN
jgi:hypothetical protein